MSSSSLGKQFGDCYRTAFRTCMDFEKEGRENISGVHATVPMMMEGRNLGHAWVEYDKPTNGGTQRMVVDRDNAYEGVAEDYYGAFESLGLGGVQAARSYSPTEYMDRMARSMRENTPPFGPWDDE